MTKAEAKKIVKCFKSVEWEKQKFYVHEKSIKDSDGNIEFYSAPKIDEAIKKLNKILNKAK